MIFVTSVEDILDESRLINIIFGMKVRQARLDARLTTLSSSVVQRFTFEEFGFESGDLTNLLTRKPDKVTALLHAVLEIARR
jgi:hypothetical protein